MKKNFSSHQNKFSREDWHKKEVRIRKGITVCQKCFNVFFKKKWSGNGVINLKQYEKDGKEINTGMCPACKMIRDKLFEGELLVEGFQKKHEEELVNLIRNFGKHSEEKDSQHRIIGIRKTGNGYRITTTENQLANRIAKKIKEAFSTVDVEVSYSREPYEVERVKAIFHQIFF